MLNICFQSVACVMLLYVTGRHLRKFQEYTITWSQSKNHLKGGWVLHLFALNNVIKFILIKNENHYRLSLEQDKTDIFSSVMVVLLQLYAIRTFFVRTNFIFDQNLYFCRLNI